MKILFVGGTGRLSLDTVLLSVSQGHEVYLFNRGSNNTMAFDNLHYILGNINDVAGAKAKLEGYEFDAVIDYLTYTVNTLKDRIEVFNGKTKQYIFVSSATVFKPRGEAISEKSDIGNDEWTYCKHKLICENYLRNNASMFSFAYTIVRPYVTYDKKRIPFPVISKKSCWNLMYRVEHDLPIIMCGDGEQRVTLTSTKDFAVGMLGLVGNEKAFAEDFNIVGDFQYSWNDVIREVETYLGKKAVVVYVPLNRIGKLIPSFSQEVLYDKGLSHCFDNDKLKSVVPKFQTTVTLHDGLKETLDFLAANADQHKLDSEWNAMENVVARKSGYDGASVSFHDIWLYVKNERIRVGNIKRAVKKIVGGIKR